MDLELKKESTAVWIRSKSHAQKVITREAKDLKNTEISSSIIQYLGLYKSSDGFVHKDITH